MSVYSFDQTDVLINRTGLLCESASLNQQNNLRPIYTLGKQKISNQSPNGPITSNLNLNYTIDTTNEPIYAISTGIIAETGDYQTTIVEIGGITGSYYLENYNFRVSPNQIINSNASFVSFLPLSGQPISKQSNISYNLSGWTGVANAWNTYVYLDTLPDIIPLYDLNYSFKANWEPIYVLGQKYPNQVKLQNGQQDFSFISETFDLIAFSGKDIRNVYGITGLFVDMWGLGTSINVQSKRIQFNFSGAQVKNIAFDNKIDDIGRININATKYF